MNLLVNQNKSVQNSNYIDNRKKFVNFRGLNIQNDSFENQNTKEDESILTKIKNKASNTVRIFTGRVFETIIRMLRKSMVSDIGNEDALTLKYMNLKGQEFLKSPEGIKRANMSDKQIKQKVNKTMERIFKNLNIPKEYQPKMEINSEMGIYAGFYEQNTHTIKFNPKIYKQGIIEMETVLMHEATHCKEALKRAGIPQNRIDEIIKNELILKIQNNEPEKIVMYGTDYTTMPKMSQNMKNDFVDFAKENLYVKSSRFNFELSMYKDIKGKSDYNEASKILKYAKNKDKITAVINGINTIIKNNPDFITQYKNEDEAFNALLEYSLSQNTRYNKFTTVEIGTGLSGKLPALKVKELEGKELEEAEKSLINSVSLYEDNHRFQFRSKSVLSNMMYKFTPEEVLAETNGQKFLIETYKDKYLNETLKPGEEEYLVLQIKKAKLEIEYIEKGFDGYKKYKEFLDNKGNGDLLDDVMQCMDEINMLKLQIEDLETQIRQIREK